MIFLLFVYCLCGVFVLLILLGLTKQNRFWNKIFKIVDIILDFPKTEYLILVRPPVRNNTISHSTISKCSRIVLLTC